MNKLNILLLMIISIGLVSALPSPISYWNMDSASGNLTDVVGTMNLVPGGTPTYSLAGKLGTAVQLDATGDYFNNSIASAIASIQFGLTGNFSYSFWIKTTDSSDARVIFKTNSSTLGTGNNATSLSVIAGGQQEWNVWSAGGRSYIDSPILSTGNWVHVVLTRNGNDNNMSMYINGTLYNASVLTARNASSNGFFLGGGLTSNSSIITLDDFCIYNIVINQSTVSSLYNSGTGNICGSIGKIGVSLVSPLNNSQTSSTNLTFNATLTASVYSITNATIFIWHDNGTVFNITTNTSISGSQALFNISNFVFDTYFWNVRGCQGNGVGSNCSNATANYSFDYIPFTNSGESYSTNVYETDNETFYLNITTDSSVSNLGSFLVYNGTRYAANHSCTSGLCQFSTTIDIPLNVGGSATENKSFYWQITIFGNFGSVNSTTTVHNQNVTNISFIKCGSGTNTVNFTTYNETTLAVVPTNFSVTFNYYLGSGSVKDSYNYSSGGTSTIDFCIDQNENYFVSSDIRIQNGTSQRNYQFLKEVYNSVLTLQPLYLPDDDASDIIIELKDQGLIPIQNYLIKVYRFYPAYNSYKLIESKITDEFGQIVAKLINNQPIYKFEFYDDSKTLHKTSDKIGAVCRTSICYLPFVIEGENGYLERYDNLSLVTYSLIFNNVTNIATFSWDDQRGESATMRMEVTRYTTNSSTVVCNSTSTSTVSALSCSLGSTKATYKIQIFRRITGESEKRITLLNVEVGDISSTFGIEGLFWIFILLFTCFGIGAFNPTAGALLYGIGFIMMGILGFISMPIPVFFANTLLVAIFIWAVRT